MSDVPHEDHVHDAVEEDKDPASYMLSESAIEAAAAAAVAAVGDVSTMILVAGWMVVFHAAAAL